MTGGSADVAAPVASGSADFTANPPPAVHGNDDCEPTTNEGTAERDGLLEGGGDS